MKNTRKSLKVLQHSADKENLVGRTSTVIDTKLGSERLKKQDASTQTNQDTYLDKAVQANVTVTVEDLTAEEASSDYWRILAEKRGESLNERLQENEKLKEHIDALKEENRICKEMLDESKNLVEVLQVSFNFIFTKHAYSISRCKK